MMAAKRRNRARNVKRLEKQQRRTDRLERIERDVCLHIANLGFAGVLHTPPFLDPQTGMARRPGDTKAEAMYSVLDFLKGNSLTLRSGSNNLAEVHADKFFYVVRRLGWRAARYIAFQEDVFPYYKVKWPAARLREMFKQRSLNPTS